MTVRIVCVGKMKEKFYADAVKEYKKRLSNRVKLDIVEVKDFPAPDRLSPAEEAAVKDAEGELILKAIQPNDHVIALAIEGRRKDSLAFAAQLQNLMNAGKSSIAFVIGGSLGLSDAVLKRADDTLSFSDFTFCHQLMRVILLEQIYRAVKINAGESYHK
ncbi:MAG: 23S rRNA (pseudouridine(1915)-N(3))-methyltransferase RlmH [Christensenellales bacterium]